MKLWIAKRLMRWSMALWERDGELSPNERWDTGECCPRWAMEPQYHNDLCWVQRNWRRRNGELSALR